jgi:hypothetical protein
MSDSGRVLYGMGFQHGIVERIAAQNVAFPNAAAHAGETIDYPGTRCTPRTNLLRGCRRATAAPSRATISTPCSVLPSVGLCNRRQAADLDHRTTVLPDACADGDVGVHRGLLEKVLPRQGGHDLPASRSRASEG